MSLRDLPDLQVKKLPSVCAFEADPIALERWNAGVQARDSDDNTITILDVIGEDYWTGRGVTSERIAAALRRIGSQDVVVEINSPGGDFFDGIAIYNMLRAHPHKVTVKVIGLAASAASVIAMAGDEIQIGKTGFMMIHNAWTIALGNRHDLIEAAETIEPFDDAMATLYASRSGDEKSKVIAWMDDETWFNGEQAVEVGLADGFLPADAVTEDQTKAKAMEGVNATRRIDALLAKSGMPRTERRALLSDAKGGKPDAAPTATHDAGELAALAKGLFKI
ncbi:MULTISPECIES: head maturation protease, ClpP-related [unclassified Shimia]|uniref:head maturation protease, ClpP-related n=1 Tax=unclassified Shimia TaxID=2630038 RepID=UPI001ADAF798|nr:head maturation protease, ClpP-related [Shimia sp. R9_2]MBO9398740.1 Clp protease ClpP [Shimia sp. R9_2]